MPKPRRWQVPALIIAVFTIAGLSRFAHFWLDDLARGRSGTGGMKFIEEMTGSYAAAVIFLVLVWVVNRYPLDRDGGWRRLPGYVVLVVLLGLAHTTLMWVSRELLAPLAGLGSYDYGLMWYRYPMEFAIQAPNIVLYIAVLHAWRYYRGVRARELHAAQLQGELDRARLARLEAQLQPHFLFNTLNAISSLMYGDPALADRMMGRLSDLLRLTFERAPAAEVPLEGELEWLGWYLEIMQLRFGDRLTIRQQIDPDARQLTVPRLVLQPLVENALTHGAARHAGPASVTIEAHRAGTRLHLVVTDDGPGIAGDPSRMLVSGVGLSNTVARLQVLYGSDARIALANVATGGLEVRLDLPARAA